MSSEEIKTNGTVYSPLDQFTINSILLYREGWSNEEKFEIKEMLYELNFYEDIEDIMSATIVLMDYANITDNFPLVGGERLDIRYKTPILETERSAKYIVAKVAAKEITQDGQNIIVLALDLVTPERWVDANNTLSKSYQGTYSDIVAEIMGSFSDVDRPDLPNPKPLVSDETLFVQRFIAPNWSPLKCVFEISRRAMGDDHEPFFFFETLDGFCFYSIKNMFGAESYAQFRIEPGQVIEDTTDPDRKFNRALRYEIMPYQDRMDQFAIRAFGTRFCTIDPISKRFTLAQTADYRVMSAQPTFHKIETNPIVDPYIYGREVDGDVRIAMLDKSNEGFFYRRMTTGLLNDQRIKVAVPGNSAMRAGLIVDLDLPDRSVSHYKDEQVSSGRWLIRSLKQVITRETFTTVMELVKNSYAINVSEKVLKEPVYDATRAEQPVAKQGPATPEQKEVAAE